MSVSDPDFQAWIDRARAESVLDVAQSLGAQLKRTGTEWQGPCPSCGGKDRFGVNPAENVYLCRGSDGKGDGINMVQHVLGIDFVPACEWIIGEPPPRSDRQAQSKPVDLDAERARHESARDKHVEREAKDRAAQQAKVRRAVDLFNEARPSPGTLVEKYLKSRSITLTSDLAKFLRFLPEYPYWNGENENGEPVVVARSPAMLAMMLDASMEVCGIHVTYLDPSGLKKLEIKDGDGNSLDARKARGKWGLIQLSEIRPAMAIGEGIETTVSYYQLALDNQDFGIAAAGNIGRLCGASLASMPHPTIPSRTIHSGDPDPDRGPVALPKSVNSVILLGDNDPDPIPVQAALRNAARAHYALGREVSVHTAPPLKGMKKTDWNDVLKAIRAGA